MSATPIESPAPGAWVSRETGLPAQLIRVEGDTCWYTLLPMRIECPISIIGWLESMRPA